MREQTHWLVEQNKATLARISKLPNGTELIFEAALDWLERSGWYRDSAGEHVLRFACKAAWGKESPPEPSSDDKEKDKP